MEGLYLRGKTYWFRFRPAANAPQARLNLRTADEAEAILAARKIKSRPHSYTSVAGVSDYILKYVTHKERQGCSKSWANIQRLCLQEAAKHFDPAPQRVSRDQVEAWQRSVLTEGRPYKKPRKDPAKNKKPPVSARTAATYTLWVRRFFAWLEAQGAITASPFEGIEIPKTPPTLRKKFMSAEEANLLLTTRTALRLEEHRELCFCLYASLHAGLRKAEVLACRPSWFDMKNGLLHVQNEEDFTIKDRDNRTIPLTAEFRKFLEGYGMRSPYMVAPSARQGKGPYRFEFKKWYIAHLEACGLHGFTFHDLRRTFASLLVSSGVSCYKVAKWLGDGVEVVERHYGHLIAGDDDINRSWAKAPPPLKTKLAEPPPA